MEANVGKNFQPEAAAPAVAAPDTLRSAGSKKLGRPLKSSALRAYSLESRTVLSIETTKATAELLKAIAIEEGMTQQVLLCEALNRLFGSRGRPTIAIPIVLNLTEKTKKARAAARNAAKAAEREAALAQAAAPPRGGKPPPEPSP